MENEFRSNIVHFGELTISTDFFFFGLFYIGLNTLFSLNLIDLDIRNTEL